MSIRIMWRSIIFCLTIIFIYLAFPILIVPSSTPMIKALFIENEYPSNWEAESPTAMMNEEKGDPQIYEISLPTIPTLQEKFLFLTSLHQQGMKIILSPFSP
jgi:hypothetical protein